VKSNFQTIVTVDPKQREKSTSTSGSWTLSTASRARSGVADGAAGTAGGDPRGYSSVPAVDAGSRCGHAGRANNDVRPARRCDVDVPAYGGTLSPMREERHTPQEGCEVQSASFRTGDREIMTGVVASYIIMTGCSCFLTPGHEVFDPLMNRALGRPSPDFVPVARMATPTPMRVSLMDVSGIFPKPNPGRSDRRCRR
jgi:hypothetical protein